ncbi:FMN-binding negative transcriptional regulator [Rheinheimera sp. WS51]|uniref:FMN-binding negative transcriptional regulator n=1 Tax=Rheinheimera sp. WS51 TaxID=3425886 RepID=UPI003D93525B
MYINRMFEERRVDVMHNLIKSHPLGAITVHGSNGITADHIPLLLDTEAGPYGTLTAHVARTNRFYEGVPSDQQVLVVFKGADAYVSPTWLANRKTHGRVQPSWAYAVVHAYCTMSVINGRQWMEEHLEKSVDFFEQDMAEPWSLSEPPAEFVNQLYNHLTGIELKINSLVGKWQLMQQRLPNDRLSIANGMREQNLPQSHQVADLIEQTINS